MLSDVMPNFGQTVTVKPSPGRRVQDGAYTRTILPPEGTDRVFDEFWHNRLMEGAVTVDWPGRVKAAPVRAPSAPVKE